jgi:MoaA/NifB/PqqE/SkfB family radical SAM enzyme
LTTWASAWTACAETHDHFRRLEGAFDRSLAAVRHLHARGVKVGLRFTMTAMNAHDLPALLELMRDEGVDKFYFSHLNYAGRGNIHRGKDAHFSRPRATRWTCCSTRAWQAAQEGRERRLRDRQQRRRRPLPAAMGAAARMPQWVAPLRERLVAWGGNSSGVNVANIDNLGTVHPDTMWWHHDLGSVRERPFSAIWPTPPTR